MHDKQVFTSSPNPHSWQSLLKLLGSVTAVQALGFVLLPWLGRLYTKEDYGILGTIMALVGITTLLANGRYEQAIAVAPSGGRIRLLRTLGLGINTGLTLLLTVICLIAPIVLEGSRYGHLIPYLFIIPLTTGLSGLFAIFASEANVSGAYGRISIASLVQGYVNNGLKIIGGLASMGVWGFAMAFNSGLAIGAFILGIGNRSAWWQGVTKRRIAIVARYYRKFPLFTIPQGIVAMLISSILPLMLPNYYTTAQIGLITMLYMITRRPVQVYSDATSRIYARRMVEARSRGEHFAQEWRRLTLRIIGMMIAGLIIAPWIITDLVTLVLGDQWTELGSIIVVMIPFLATEGLNFIFDFVPDVVGRQHQFLMVQSIRLALEVVFVLLVAPKLEFTQFIQAYFIFAAVAYLCIHLWFYKLIREADQAEPTGAN